MSEPAFRVMPLSPLRTVIAARMSEVQRTVPQYRVAMDIEMDDVLALRESINRNNPKHKVSVNDVIIKACAMALMQQSDLNIQWVDNCIHRYAQADISVIVAVEGGLSAPVIRAANTKSMLQISRELRDLAERAAENRLKLSEVSGGTFSISNLGMYGVDEFDAIINAPQCAILAVSAVKPRAVIKDGTVQSAALMRATLSLDHRAIDGASGALFLSTLREMLEKPRALFEA